MKKLLITALAAWPAVAGAQTGTAVKQSGNVTPGHPVMWSTNGVVQDAGPALLGFLTGVGVVASGAGICQNSASTGARNRVCFTASSTGAGLIMDSFGGATGPFTLTLNGTTYQFPFSTSGVIGPNPTTVGRVAIWNNTVGTLLTDSGNAAISGGLTISPGAGILPAITTAQSLSGGSLPTGNAANLIFINADTAQGGAGAINGFAVSHNVGGSAATGSRQSIASFLNLSAPTNASNPNRNYVALYGNAFSAAGDGGTNTGAGAQGGLFGVASWTDGQSGATNLLSIGPEFDISCRTGCSTKHKFALLLTDHALDAVAGATTDAGLVLSGQVGGVGLSTGISFSDTSGQHMVKSSGTLINSTGGTFATGIDFSASTLTTFLKGPAFTQAANGNTTIGPTAGSVPLDINANANSASVSAPAATVQFRMAGADAAANNVDLDSFGNANSIIYRRADGTAASRTGLVANDNVGALAWQGWTSAAAYSGTSATIRAIATETWSGTALGSQIDFRTTPNTTNTIATAMSVQNSGGVTVGSGAADPGIGKINATNGYNSGGTAGLSVTKTVRASGGGSDCTMTFTGGLLTASTC